MTLIQNRIIRYFKSIFWGHFPKKSLKFTPQNLKMQNYPKKWFISPKNRFKPPKNSIWMKVIRRKNSNFFRENLTACATKFSRRASKGILKNYFHLWD